MKAWLERVSPPGEAIELPDGAATMVFGRSQRCTIVFDDKTVSARHCELTFDRTFWQLRDLGSTTGTRVNGVALHHAQALFTGDLLELGQTQLRFVLEAEHDDGAMLASVMANPDSEPHWLVYCDWLIERGDPLGERIVRARAGQRIDHQPWLGPLWPHHLSGAVELEWKLGFVVNASIRAIAGRPEIDWRHSVSALCSARVGAILRALTIDLPRLEPGPAEGLPSALGEAQRTLSRLPNLRPSIERLNLGYAFRTPMETVTLLPELGRRLPKLQSAQVFIHAQGARLTQISSVDVARFVGLKAGSRALTDLTRLRKGERREVHLETPPGMASLALEGNPCFFARNGLGWSLTAGRLRGEVRVNGRTDAMFHLLPGDVIEVVGAGKLCFELVA